MSDVVDQTKKQLEEFATLEAKKQELQVKEFAIKERRVNNDFDNLSEHERELQLIKQANFGVMTQEQIDAVRRENVEYILAAREKITFIDKIFDKVVPFFRKNIILIGAKTGEGKSTAVANIAASVMSQIDPKTKKRKRVLVITNEERTSDVYNRVTCLSQGWHYVNHDKFTDVQLKTFDRYINEILTKDGWLNVIDNFYGGTKGTTTTIEGIESIFENLIREKIYYDAVIIDYYQNVKASKKNPHLNEWQVQEKLAAMLDSYKNVYPAPIVLLAQVSPADKENKTPFKQRIEGRKVILNVVTCALEMIANKAELTTEWIVHKSRFNEYVGGSVVTGYENGRFVDKDDKFLTYAQKVKQAREKEAQDKLIGVPSVLLEAPKKEEE